MFPLRSTPMWYAMSIHPCESWWYRWSARMRPGAFLLSPRNTAVWWIVNRLGIWGVPPGGGGRAPQASRHNKTPDGTLNTGAGTVMSSPGGLAIVLDSGPVVTARRGLMPAVGSVTLCGRTGLVHALTKAATPAPP